MSSQPSTVDDIRSAASQATHALATTLDPADNSNHEKASTQTKDAQGTAINKGSYQDQLNRAASGDQPKRPDAPESMVEKVASYVPGMSALQQTMFGQPAADQKEEPVQVKDNGPTPSKPHNDAQVAQFLQDQYQSKRGDGFPDGKETK